MRDKQFSELVRSGAVAHLGSTPFAVYLIIRDRIWREKIKGNDLSDHYIGGKLVTRVKLAELSKTSGLSIRAIRDAITRLAELGYLEKIENRGGDAMFLLGHVEGGRETYLGELVLDALESRASDNVEIATKGKSPRQPAAAPPGSQLPHFVDEPRQPAAAPPGSQLPHPPAASCRTPRQPAAGVIFPDDFVTECNRSAICDENVIFGKGTTKELQSEQQAQQQTRAGARATTVHGFSGNRKPEQDNPYKTFAAILPEAKNNTEVNTARARARAPARGQVGNWLEFAAIADQLGDCDDVETPIAVKRGRRKCVDSRAEPGRDPSHPERCITKYEAAFLASARIKGAESRLAEYTAPEIVAAWRVRFFDAFGFEDPDLEKISAQKKLATQIALRARQWEKGDMGRMVEYLRAVIEWWAHKRSKGENRTVPTLSKALEHDAREGVSWQYKRWLAGGLADDLARG